jgi:hypothetical protein
VTADLDNQLSGPDRARLGPQREGLIASQPTTDLSRFPEHGIEGRIGGGR